MKYTLKITRENIYGTVEIIHQEPLTADEVIERILQSQPFALVNEDLEEIFEEIEEGKDDVAISNTGLAYAPEPEGAIKTRTCGNCGQPGHNRRSCPIMKGKKRAPATNDEAPDFYYQDILDMLRDGLEEDEIYKTVYTSITEKQYREALEWAKSQL